MALPLDEWYQALPVDDLAGLMVRAGMAKGDRNPSHIAFLVVEVLPWMAKKELVPQVVESGLLLQAVEDVIDANSGAEEGVLIRIVPYLRDGRKLSSWTRTAREASSSWRTLPPGEKAAELYARGMAEAQAGMARSMVAFMDKATEAMGVMGQTLSASHDSQREAMHDLIDINRAWIEAMAEDVGQAAEDMASMPEAKDNGLQDMVLDILRNFAGMDAEDATPDPEVMPEAK